MQIDASFNHLFHLDLRCTSSLEMHMSLVSGTLEGVVASNLTTSVQWLKNWLRSVVNYLKEVRSTSSGLADLGKLPQMDSFTLVLFS